MEHFGLAQTASPNRRGARLSPRLGSDARIHGRGRAPRSRRAARDAEMLATRATCVALWLCLAVAPLSARAAAPSASQTATFVEKQGHMLLLNGAQHAVQRGRCGRARISPKAHRTDVVLFALDAAGDAYVIANETLRGAPTDALTFEAWIRTTDDCSDGTLLSYSVDPEKCAARASKDGAPLQAAERAARAGTPATTRRTTSSRCLPRAS
jgi:hypothetical protein